MAIKFLNTVAVDDSVLFVDTINNRVGIGTTSPSAKLHIKNTGEAKIRLEDSDSANLAFDLIVNEGTGFSIEETIGGDSGDVTRLLIQETTGNVGIGTTSPSQKLEVVGNIQATGTRSISSLFDGNHYMRIESNSSGGILKGADGGVITTLVRTYGDSYFNGGNVGIGTTSPAAKLDIISSGLSTMFRLSNTEANATTKYGAILGRHYTNAEENVTGMLITSSSSSTGGTVSIGGGITSANAVNTVIFYTAANNTTLTGTERMRISPTGNVGIGTTSPSTKLEVNGDVKIGDATTGATFANSGDVFLITGVDTASNAFNSIHLKADSLDTGLVIQKDTNNVGIGTTGPSQKLEVSTDAQIVSKFVGNTNDGTGFIGAVVEIETNNDARGRGIYLTHRDSSDTSDSEWYMGTPYNGGGLSIGNAAYGTSVNSATGPAHKDQSKLFVTEAGNVGIGTTSPSRQLTLSGNSSPIISLASNTTGGEPSIYFGDTADDNAGRIVYSNSQDAMQIWTAAAQRMRITSDGNVGIGTTSPSEKLEVAGNVKVSGTIGIFNGATQVLNIISSGSNAYINTGTSGGTVQFGAPSTNVTNITVQGLVTAEDINISGGDGYLINGMGFAIESSGLLSLGDWDGNDFQTRIMDQNAVEVLRVNDEKVGIGTTAPASKLQVNGGVQIADDTDAASANKVGTLKYRVSGNNSYVDMCMQTGPTSYAWVNITENNW